MDGHRGAGGPSSSGAGRAAHGLGEVGGVLHRRQTAPRSRAGRHGDRVAAIGVDAQPGGRGRAGGGSRRHNQLEQCRRVGRDPRTRAPSRARRPAGQPGTVEQPRLSRPGAARAGTRRRPCGGGRGALRVGLGARLPARLPAHPHPDRRTGCRRSSAGDHGDRQRPSGGGCRDPVGRRGTGHVGAARRAGPRVAAAVGGHGGQSGSARGLACSAY